MLVMRFMDLDDPGLLPALHPGRQGLAHDQLHRVRIGQASHRPGTADLHLYPLPSRGGPMIPDSLVILLMVAVFAYILIMTGPSRGGDR